MNLKLKLTNILFVSEITKKEFMNLKLKLTNVLFVSEITKKEVNVITVPNKENMIVHEPKTKVN